MFFLKFRRPYNRAKIKEKVRKIIKEELGYEGQFIPSYQSGVYDYVAPRTSLHRLRRPKKEKKDPYIGFMLFYPNHKRKPVECFN